MSLGHDLLAKGTHFFPKLARWSLTSGGGLRIAAQDRLTLSECEGVHVAAYYLPPQVAPAILHHLGARHDDAQSKAERQYSPNGYQGDTTGASNLMLSHLVNDWLFGQRRAGQARIDAGNRRIVIAAHSSS
jgi:hypothetical protein